MRGNRPLPIRLVGFLILGVLPILSAAIPVLDVWGEDSRVGIQDHFHPESCGYPHNHLICIQQSASQWAPGAEPPPPFRAWDLKVRIPLLASASPHLSVPLRSPRPRAPPAFPG